MNQNDESVPDEQAEGDKGVEGGKEKHLEMKPGEEPDRTNPHLGDNG